MTRNLLIAPQHRLMPKSVAKKKAHRVTFHTAPSTSRTHIDHKHVQYSVTRSSDVARISATTLSIQTLSVQDDEVETSEVGAETSPAVAASNEGVSSAAPNDDMSSAASGVPLDEAYLAFLGTNPDVNATEKAKRIRAKGDEALRDFVPRAGMFLEEMIGLEGRGELATETCATCMTQPALYECIDCGSREMMCMACTVLIHSKLFLHRIQKWNGSFFEKTTLKALGLRVQLGHRSSERCIKAEQVRKDDFVVIDINGIHEIGLNFCGCANVTHNHTVQLLRARLFPSTTTNPKSAATFRCLEYMELLSYEGKLSVFEFYQTLTRCTDNTGLSPPKDRYPALLRMIHEWRHLKLMKRAGRGHDSRGIQGTREGECAVLCPACPQPGKNFKAQPNTDQSSRHLNALFVAIDANFRLKRKNVSSNQADPGLNRGCAYFVEETKYKEYLKKFVDEKEPKSTCSRHDAVNLSEKSNLGHAATGVGACVCARHDMRLPVSVGDLQRGERYCNMDYIFHSALKNTEVKTFVISYDIACQWSIHLEERMRSYDREFFLFNSETLTRYLVPKFHLPAHIAKCRSQYSFNYAPNTGRTEGEAPEREWVPLNKLATSTREMGPGSRMDTLDSQMGDENWKKVIGMGLTLCRKMRAAAKDMAEHVIGHNEMSSTIPVETRTRWTEEIEAWEMDHSQRNPYEVTIAGPTQAAVLKQLAEDEAADIASGRDMSLDDKMTPSVLISLGLDLEREQRRLKKSAKAVWEHALDRQRSKHQYQINTLQRKIDTWISYQTLYFPGVPKLRHSFDLKRGDPSVEVKIYDIVLWLPSQIKGLLNVPPHLQRIEWKLRHSQAHEALDTLQTQLQIRAHLYKFKDCFIRGQSANTRARNTISGVEAKIEAAAEEYRAAFAALTALAPSLFEFQWKNELLPLNPEDIRDISEGKETRKGKESEGKRTTSWIWTKVAVDEESDGEFFTDRIRAEWCKSKARADRFSEEVSLLSQEMMRVLEFFEWKAGDWEKKALRKNWEIEESDDNQCTASHPIQEEGRIAYAKRQAAMHRKLGEHCKELWAELPKHVARMLSIIEDPSLAMPGEFDEPTATVSKYNKKKK